MTYPYILEPTPENLQRYRRERDDITYWHTADFWRYDDDLQDCLADLSDTYTELLFGSDEPDEDRALRQIQLKMGRLIIEEARARGIDPKNLRDQLNAYATILMTPICIWKTSPTGEISYSLNSNLPRPKTPV
ncbi:MAG: hypothetical protein ACKO7W_20850 [Elainella sp.]